MHLLYRPQLRRPNSRRRFRPLPWYFVQETAMNALNLTPTPPFGQEYGATILINFASPAADRFLLSQSALTGHHRDLVQSYPGKSIHVNTLYWQMHGRQTFSRTSHISAFLIASRGFVQGVPCTHCARSWKMFRDCIRLPGEFNDCCANCKWHDEARKCSLGGEFEYPPSPRALPAPRRTLGPPRAPAPVVRSRGGSYLALEPAPMVPQAGSSQNNPLVIVDDGGESAENPIVMKEEGDVFLEGPVRGLPRYRGGRRLWDGMGFIQNVRSGTLTATEEALRDAQERWWSVDTPYNEDAMEAHTERGLMMLAISREQQRRFDANRANQGLLYGEV